MVAGDIGGSANRYRLLVLLLLVVQALLLLVALLVGGRVGLSLAPVY